MKLRRALHPMRGPIDATPLVNIVLLLMFFFLLTSSFVFQSGIKVEMPRSPIAGGVNTRYIVVISAQNPSLIFFNDQVVSLESLDAQFQRIARGEAHAAVMLRADKSVLHGVVVDVMNRAMRAGLSVVIATQPEISDSKPLQNK